MVPEIATRQQEGGETVAEAQGLPPSHGGRATRGFNLLRVPLLRGFLTSRLYPGLFQWVVALGFGLILAFALFGTVRGGKNLATVVTWTLWWPLLPVSLLLFGRAWCAVCPLAATASSVQKLAKPRRRRPARFLRRYGIWLMSLTFVGLTWADRVWNIVGSPRATGTILLVLLAGAVLFGLLYQRRVWCRYLCPIGALTGIYSMPAAVELRAEARRCQECRTKDCYTGNAQVEGCPLFEFPMTMESNRNCNLCANCIKACPHNSIEVRLRPPARELWQIRQPILGEALLVVVMVGLVYFQTIDMTFAWGDYMKWLMETTGIAHYNLAFSLNFLAVVVLALLLFSAAVLVSSFVGAEDRKASFARFGYAYLPLALAGHLGHNLSHLLGEGPTALQTAFDQLRLPLVLFPAATAPQLAVGSPLALAILSLGAVASLYSAWRIGENWGKERGHWLALPHLVLLLLLAAVFAQMFLLPMNPRHAH